jgi:ABC-type nitrate/sulfonate/bicarbonate transport system ATPase subunit
MNTVLSVNAVCKTFPQRDVPPLNVLNSVSLAVNNGDFTALVGPSGCGKSTLLRIIAGLEKADCGNITLDGVEVNAPGFERGLVFQDPSLFPWLNIYENVAFGLKARHVYKNEKEQVLRYLHLVGLAGFEKAFPHELSGGMAQRVALARALVNKPKVLLLDESLGALDAFTRMTMQDEILDLWQASPGAIVMVTHDIDEAIYMATRIIVMSSRPAKIECDITVEIDRPRRRDALEFLALRAKILQLLHFAGRMEKAT